MPSRIQIAKPDIIQALDKRASAGQHVFNRSDLAGLLKTQRSFWRLAQYTTLTAFIEFLCERTHLEEVVLTSDVMPQIRRYVWRQASPFEIALSLKPSAYLSHGSAVYLHALSDQLPAVIYVNQEQTPKPVPAGELTQEGLDRAFTSAQRVSKSVYALGDKRVVILSGKWTENLGTEDLQAEGARLKVTSVERTLIDIVVRPYYAGGPHQVLKSYRGARERVSTNVLVSYLKKLDYKYPYAQAIGYYASVAGYPAAQLERLRSMVTGLNFYLDHGLQKPDYDPTWRLFIPRGFERSA